MVASMLYNKNISIILMITVPEIFVEKGDPWMCFPFTLMLTLYSPGDMGTNEQRVDPSLFSFLVMSALDGPSIEIARSPGNKSYAKTNEAEGICFTFQSN